MTAKEIKVGACYRTKAGQVRHVMEINGTKVKYEGRGKQPVPMPWPVRASQEMDDFLNDIVEEVGCYTDLDAL